MTGRSEELMHHPNPHPNRQTRRPHRAMAGSVLSLLLLLAGTVAAVELPSWAAVQCPEVAYLIGDGDLNGARVQAQQGRLDCMVLVAEAHRGRGDIRTALDVLKDVIGFAEDPQRDTYPLLLFYKVAYLNGTKADFSNLQRRDTGLAEQARQVFLTRRRDEILGYLRDPRGKDCPQVSPPFDDAGLDRLKSVCEAARAWQQADSTGAASLDEQLRLLDALGNAYSGQVYGQDLKPPYWIGAERDRIQQDLGCVTHYNKHINTYHAARNGALALTAQRDALLAAQDAIRPCRDRLAQLRIDEARIEGALARVEQQIRDREERMSARQRLEQEITEALQLNMIPSESQVESWEQQVRRILGGYLSQRCKDALIALRSYHRCDKEYPSIWMDERLPPDCEQLGFRAMPQPNKGQKVVRGDQAVALAVIRGYIGGTPVTAAAGCDLYKTFTFLSEATATFQGKPPNSFEPTVRTNLKECGASINCISTETMAAIQPRKAWVWTAFADCRLQEARYGDAVQNLDIAAGHVRPDRRPDLEDLIVRRLQAVADRASGAGERGFDEAGLRSKVGLKKGSRWLRDALAVGPRAPPPRPPTNTPSESINSRLATASRSAPPPPSTGHVTGGPDDRWYANHWNEAATLTYFETLGTNDPDIGQVMTSVEQAHPELLGLMRYWDQIELGSSVAIGSEAVKGIVDRLGDAEPDRLDRVASEVARSKSSFDLRNELGFYPADFAVYHAIARRAIELDCPSIAAEQLQPIGAKHLRAVGPEAAGLHRLVLGYVNDQAGSPDACTGR
jgi:hypothetical protein